MLAELYIALGTQVDPSWWRLTAWSNLHYRNETTNENNRTLLQGFHLIPQVEMNCSMDAVFISDLCHV